MRQPSGQYHEARLFLRSEFLEHWLFLNLGYCVCCSPSFRLFRRQLHNTYKSLQIAAHMVPLEKTVHLFASFFLDVCQHAVFYTKGKRQRSGMSMLLTLLSLASMMTWNVSIFSSIFMIRVWIEPTVHVECFPTHALLFSFRGW